MTKTALNKSCLYSLFLCRQRMSKAKYLCKVCLQVALIYVCSSSNASQRMHRCVHTASLVVVFVVVV